MQNVQVITNLKIEEMKKQNIKFNFLKERNKERNKRKERKKPFDHARCISWQQAPWSPCSS